MVKKLYYWRDVLNFGDALAPLLLQHFSGIDTYWTPLGEAEIVVTGSVLHHIGPNWPGTVAGAGKLLEDTSLKLRQGPTKILAVRGPLSAKGLKGDFALGDPGLLADELVSVDTKRYDIGVLPHWTDHELTRRPEWYSDEWMTVNISSSNNPWRVLREIGMCRKLVTSSLHGMILADAFGIPRRFEPCARTTLDTLFKFHDYSASINLPLKIGVTQKAHRGYVEARKHELYDVFQGMRQ